MARTLSEYREILQQLNREDKIRAYHVAAALMQRHTVKQNADIFFEQVKTGSTFVGKSRIIDAVAIRPSWTSPCITGYEIKVERGDFLRDEKWREYLEFTNEFYFAAPPGIIEAAELPADIGLMVFNPKTKKVRTVRKATWRETRRDVAFDLLYYLVLWRSEQHKGYTNQERIEQFLAGKINGRELSYRFQHKVFDEIRETQEELESAKRKAERYLSDSQEIDRIRQLLQKAGLYKGWHNISDIIQGILDERGQTLNSSLKQELDRMIAAAKVVERMIGMKGA